MRSVLGRETVRKDAVAGLVLGVQSVPDGLAAGLLAGVSPVFGLHAYMIGTIVGATACSSVFMSVQATGAMATIIADVPAVHSGADPAGALFMLSILTGLVMLVAGIFKLGSLLRWVSNAVMVGFINAVGINIVLGQLDTLTGYDSEGGNRVTRTLDLLLNLGQLHMPSLVVGLTAIALIVLLERTRLGPIGLVVAVVATSAAVVPLGWDVMRLNDITEVPRLLPAPVLPSFDATLELMLPAAALAFVGLVQGAAVSANFPNPNRKYPEPSRDFIGQGIANIASGIWQGMPVGGSMSATAIVKTAGAKSRAANLIAGIVIAIAILLVGPVVGYIAMPALAGLLIVVGVRTVKPADLKALWRTGAAQATVMTVTFVLTMIIPLQHAVLVGVGISVILYVIRQSNRIVLKRWQFEPGGRIREVEPPAQVGANEVVVLMPYGSLFFAAAPLLEQALPDVTDSTRNSVVILRLRGKSDIGSTFMEVLVRYGVALRRAGSKLVIVSDDERMLEQFTVTGVTQTVGAENVYTSSDWLGATVARANREAQDWVTERASSR
jgi:sulfate permease, SulP family